MYLYPTLPEPSSLNTMHTIYKYSAGLGEIKRPLGMRIVHYKIHVITGKVLVLYKVIKTKQQCVCAEPFFLYSIIRPNGNGTVRRRNRAQVQKRKAHPSKFRRPPFGSSATVIPNELLYSACWAKPKKKEAPNARIDTELEAMLPLKSGTSLSWSSCLQPRSSAIGLIHAS